MPFRPTPHYQHHPHCHAVTRPLPGRTLRTIGSASQRLEALGDRTVSVVSKANQWLLSKRAIVGGGTTSTSTSTSNTTSGHGNDDDNNGAYDSVEARPPLKSSFSSALHAPAALPDRLNTGEHEGLEGVVDVVVEFTGMFDEHVQALEEMMGVLGPEAEAAFGATSGGNGGGDDDAEEEDGRGSVADVLAGAWCVSLCVCVCVTVGLSVWVDAYP